MYLPPIFSESRTEVLYQLIRAYPFATLVTHSEADLDANHLPFELEILDHGQAVLFAHIAKQNPLFQMIKNGSDVLVIFQARNAYISPSWYPTKATHHQHVPTWNYQVVHIKGKITFIEDEKTIRGILARLTRTHEASQEKPWRISDAPPAYIQTELAHIVAIKIEIENIIGKFKLGQNREKIDLMNAGNNLIAQGHTEIGQSMLDLAENKNKDV